MMPEHEVELDRIATGGAALGRRLDGKLAFVTGGLPGERVLASVVADHRTRVEADVAAVLDGAPGRRTPPCPHVVAGCGGCDWQHAEPALQRELRRSIVVDCLTRLAHLDDVDVRLGPALDTTGYRTTVRAAVRDGRPGFRASRSHEVVMVDSCLVAHPLIGELLRDGRFGAATEVTIGVGTRTGERLAIVTPTADGVVLPDDVVVIGEDELRAGRQAAYYEEIHGRRLRISAGSFFQCRPDGAEALIDTVAESLAGIPAGSTLLDAYCGVGLFGVGLVGRGPERPSFAGRAGSTGKGDRDTAEARPRFDAAARFDAVIGVESNRGAVADATENYRANGVDGRVIRAKLERWRPEPVTAVVADPARVGLGKEAGRRLAAAGADVFVLVSCDPASLARDVVVLGRHGYDLEHVTVLDLFGNTSHIETVGRFVRR